MAKPGKKPLPTALKIVRGTDQPSRVRKDEPKPAIDSIKPPEGMSTVALKQWDIVLPQLQEAKIVSNMDAHALALYCEAYATWVDANKWIQKKGAVVKSKNGFLVQSPFFHVATKAYDQMKAMLIEFGMTPSARTRIGKVPDTDDPGDGFGF